MRKVHVCMISYGFHPPWTEGCSVIARNLASALQNYVDLSVISLVRVDYLGARKEKIEQSTRGIYYLRPTSVYQTSMRPDFYQTRLPSIFRTAKGKFLLPSQMFPTAKIWSALKSLDSEHGIDIVHICNVSHLLISALVKTFLKRGTVAHVFSSSSSLGERFSQNFVDAYICTSKLSYFHLISRGLHEVHFIPPIIDCDVYQTLRKKRCQDKLNFSNNSFIVTYIGNFFPERFPFNVITEVKKLVKVNPNLELTLYAPYSVRNLEIASRLKKLLSKSKIKNRVTVSNLSEIQKVIVYNASNVLIFPFMKKFSENVVIDPPLTILEGMACGKIVIASRTLSIPEIIKNGENGFLIEPENYEGLGRTLEYVMNYFEKLKYIGVNARETILKGFSSNAVANKLMTIYQSVLY